METDPIQPEGAIPAEPAQTNPPSRPPLFPPSTPVLLTPSQKGAFERLQALARLYFGNSWHDLPIKPRLTPLIIGPSGTGKTFLVRHLARACSAGFIRISFGEWQPIAARSSPSTHTFDRIHNLLTQHGRVVIFVDELEKMRMDHEWSNCVMQELFLLLDRNPSITSGRSSWDPQALHILHRHTFIVGAGTWQEVWSSSRRAGFADEPPEEDVVEIGRRIEACARIPEELLKRFDGEYVVVRPYAAEDFVQILTGHNDHVAPQLRIEITPRLVDQLVAGRRNMRAVQELIGRRLLERASETSESVENDIPF